jgi:hypothetical protein
MQINSRNSTLSVNNVDEVEMNFYRDTFPNEVKYLKSGLKYLGFHLKPNSYLKSYFLWILEKLEKGSKFGVIGDFLEHGGWCLSNRLYRPFLSTGWL